MPNASHLRSVIALLEQLPPESGFERHTLVAFAHGDEEATERGCVMPCRPAIQGGAQPNVYARCAATP